MPVVPPETIDTMASLSSLVVRSISGICEENMRSSSWLFNITDIFFNAPLAQVSGEWLAVSEISTAKLDFHSQMIKDKRFLILEVGLRSFSMYLCVKRVNVITNKYETLWNRKN